MAARRIMTLHGRRLRDELLALRNGRGWTLATVVERAEGDFTDTTLSRWEIGESLPKATDLRRLLEVYAAPPERIRELLALLREARENQRSWWSPVRSSLRTGYTDLLSLERDASVVRSHQSTVVPGPLQTREYANAISRRSVAMEEQTDIDKVVEVRLSRQARLTDPATSTRFLTILDEAVVARLVGGSDVMRGQLELLRELGSRPNVSVRILPFAAGEHAALEGAFSLLEFPEPNPSAVYLETATRGFVSDEDADVQTYTMIWGNLDTSALDQAASDALLADVIDRL